MNDLLYPSEMSAVEITLLNFSAIDVSPLLAYFGINMLAIVSVNRSNKIVVANNLISRTRRILDAYRVRYSLDQVQIVRFIPGQRGQLNNILRFNPREMYPIEGNAYAVKTGVGIFATQLDPNQLTFAQQNSLM